MAPKLAPTFPKPTLKESAMFTSSFPAFITNNKAASTSLPSGAGTAAAQRGRRQTQTRPRATRRTPQSEPRPRGAPLPALFRGPQLCHPLPWSLAGCG